jgi:hypothetical protein
MSGHGKSNAAADLVEDVLDNHAQVIIIEPIPEWHTLKARYNNVVVVGGPYQDLPLESAFAHEYVQAALEKGISLVVNVSDIEDDADQIKFVSNFLWNLYRLEQKYRRVLFLVLEEADIWAPQMWDQTSKQSLSRVSLIAKHGRKIGIFPILISQRPADLHKSPLSQCNINLFGKFTSPADLSEKTGIMYLVKKLHLSITEEQIMKLQSGYFVVSDRSGVQTVAVRKRLCPHGADTPLIEPKPFTADLSRALGGLRDEIAKALEAKKEEQSEVKRLEHQVQDLKKQNEQLQEKANIKLSVKEMMSAGSDPVGVATPISPEFKKLEAELEEFRSGRKLAESVQQRLKFLGEQMQTKNEELQSLKILNERFAKENNAFRKLKEALTEILPTVLPTSVYTAVPSAQNGATAGLQKVTKVLTVEEHRLKVPTIRTDTAKGKILALARDCFFSTWKGLGDIQGHFIANAVNYTDDAVVKALRELVDSGIFGLKHTDRNRWKLSPDVVFEKEASV